MTDTVNRQILLVEKPSGKLGPEHFKLNTSAIPEPKDGEALLRVRYISLDAANRAWMHGATYRAAVEPNTRDGRRRYRRSGGVEGAKSCARRHRVRRYRLAGIRRGACETSHQDARGSNR